MKHFCGIYVKGLENGICKDEEGMWENLPEDLKQAVAEQVFKTGNPDCMKPRILGKLFVANSESRVRYGTLKQLLKGCKKASRHSAADSDGCQVVEGHLPPWCGLMEPPRRCFSARRASTPCCARPYPRSLRWRHRDDGDLRPFGTLTATAQAQIQKGPALVGLKVEGSGASLAEGIGLAGPL